MCRRTGRRTAALTTALYSTIFCLMGFYVGCKGPLLLNTTADMVAIVAYMVSNIVARQS